MGKKRINILDLSKKEAASDQPPAASVGADFVSALPDKPGKSAASRQPPAASKKRPPKLPSKRYQSLKKAIKKGQFYPFEKAVKLITKSASAKFDESVDIDIAVKKEKLTGSVKFPHATGKTRKIVVFDKKIEEQIKKNKADFDLLIAKPADMPKIAKYAKFLGPKGLMPNPKNKTISENPKKTIKELSAAKTGFKTEKKVPLIHMTIGKVSFGEKKLLENLEALITAINPRLIKKAVISCTMGPGIKLKIA